MLVTSTGQTPQQARVLSIQSHTVHGYVGQKASTFPLELLGVEVDPLNSVQLSNHKGYPKGAKGQILGGEELLDIIDGLDLNGLLKGYTHLLTGYVGSVSFLRAILTSLQKLRERNPNLIYFCDPVMGDNGKLYVPQELVEVYKSEVLQVATVLTPNQFEIELLTNIPIKTIHDAWKACDYLHEKGIEIVVITSCSLGVENQLSLLASQKVKQIIDADDGEGEVKNPRVENQRYCVNISLIPSIFYGTGDLMAALLLAYSHMYPDDLAKVLELATTTVQAVIRRTHESVLNGTNSNRELRLVQSARDILAPPIGEFELKVHSVS